MGNIKKGLLQGVPMLARMVERETSESFDLTNNISIEVHTASFRSTRGYTIVAALLDELAFWRGEESTDPDIEVINAIRPGMSTIPNAMLLCSSSPYARRGALWEAHRKHFGKDDDPILIWQAETRRMNPTVRQSIIDEAYERDPASADAEYGAQFRADIEGFVNREAVEACVALGCYERPAQPKLRYAAFIDPSGGASDSFTLAIAHRDGDSIFLDCVREVRPPFSPEAVVAEFASTLKAYRVSRVDGDRYAGLWPVEQFAKCGIRYAQAAYKQRITMAIHAPDYTTPGRRSEGYDIDPVTFERLDRQRTRPLVTVVRLTEKEVPAVRGRVHSKLGS